MTNVLFDLLHSSAELQVKVLAEVDKLTSEYNKKINKEMRKGYMKMLSKGLH